MHALARTHNILVQPLRDEVVLYDAARHQAHCVSKSVFTVWQNADGNRSVDQLAETLNRDLGVPCSREIVLLALEDLRQSNLLEKEAAPSHAQLPSRREIARRLSVAGLSVSMLPFVASVAAPTPAMARSGTYTSQNYQQWYSQATSEVSKDTIQLLQNKNGSLTDLNQAVSYGEAGVAAGQKSTAQTDFANALTEFNAMLQALGLPPL